MAQGLWLSSDTRATAFSLDDVAVGHWSNLVHWINASSHGECDGAVKEQANAVVRLPLPSIVRCVVLVCASSFNEWCRNRRR
jgi:hypothetical protein